MVYTDVWIYREVLNNVLVIGLTGGIGSGKSTVADLFKKLDVPVIDADIISHQLCEPNATGYNSIIEHFGVSILQDNGHIDRKKLANIVFAHGLEREWLESTLHPLIRQKMRHQAAILHAPYCIFVIPLLTESNNLDGIDRVLIVDAPEALQIERATQRDFRTVEEVKKIMAAQNSRNERLTYADDVILNDANITSLEEKVATLHACYSTMGI